MVDDELEVEVVLLDFVEVVVVDAVEDVDEVLLEVDVEVVLEDDVELVVVVVIVVAELDHTKVAVERIGDP